jgi:hypothetical protein
MSVETTMDGPTPTAEQKAKPSRGRRILVGSIIGVATLLLIVGIFAVWANRLLFNPDNWANTSTQLLGSPNIRSATANYAVDQVYANVNVGGLIKSALPTRLEPLADPAAGALRNVAVTGVETALQRPRVQALWAQANRAAAETLVNVVDGKKGTVTVDQGVVALNLSTLVDNLASRLGLPPNLGEKLPKNFANLTIFKAKQLKFVQDIGKAVQHLALALTIAVPLLYALAVFLAEGRRRRTLMNVGFAIAFGGLLVILLRGVFNGQIVDSLVSDPSLRPAAHDATAIATELLHEAAAACLWVGIPLVAAAWFAGPARAATGARRAIAPFIREHPVGTYAITLGVMAVIFIGDPIYSTGTPVGILVYTALALLGTFVLRRQTEREFPEARLGDTTARIRAWVANMRQKRHQSSRASAGAPPPNAPSSTIADQLRGLSDLRDHGAITPDEYETAKAQLLHH